MNNATQSQAISALPPDADAQALVPVDTDNLSEYKPLIENEHFAKFLNKIADFAAAQSNSPQMWERRRKTVRLRKFLCGEYYGVVDKQKGYVSAKTEGDGIYYDPQTATFLETLMASLIKTKPEKMCEPRQSDNIAQREAARVAKGLLDADAKQIFTPKRQQREWKTNLLCAGESYRITYFNPAMEGRGVSEEVFEPVLIKGGDKASYCPLCSSTATDEEGKCAKCKNPQMDTFEALGMTVTAKKGARYKQIGDVDYDIPDALEMTVIGETDSIAEALIVYRSRAIPRCVLEDALGIDNLPDTDIPDALTYKQMFEDEEGAMIPEFRKLHYEELWIAPAVYTNYKFPVDTKTQSGEVIKAGTKAKDIFPNGFYFSRTKKRITQFFPQSTGEVLSHAANSLGEGFHGQGEWDLIELQDQLTEAKSMKMNSMLLDSTQPLLVLDGVVDTESFENKFGLVIPVPRDAMTERGMDGIMRRVPLGNPPQEAYSVGEEIKGQMQNRAGAFSTQSGAPDIEAMGTATGVATLSQNSLDRRAPALVLYAQMEVEQAYQILEMRQKYWCEKMYSEVAKELGETAVKWFMKCNIRQDIHISIVENSWMPKMENQKRMDFQQLFSVIGQLLTARAAGGDTQMIDELIRQANEVFGGKIDFNDLKTNQTEAQLRLDKLKEVGEFVENAFGEMLFDEAGNTNPQAVEIAYLQTAEMLRVVHAPSGDGLDEFYNKPMDIMFDTHSEFEEVYSDWLRTAEGRAASQFVRSLVRDLADLHIQAESYRLMKLKQYSMVQQLPEVEAQKAMEAVEGEPNESQDAKEATIIANQNLSEDKKLAHEKELKAAELEDKENQRQHEYVMEERRAESQPAQ
jgi:hypothetical protein